MVEVLLEAKADVRIKTMVLVLSRAVITCVQWGETALDLALQKCNDDVVKLALVALLSQ